jgi:hypothetical protein
MARKRRKPTTSGENLRSEIFAELRNVLRLLTELRSPLQLFLKVDSRPPGAPSYYVVFDRAQPHEITGLRIGALTLRLRDVTIINRCYECAQAIWHLKDRLHQWAKQTDAHVNVEEWVAKSTVMLICGDLANRKKHFRRQVRSGRSPKIGDEITIDTSKSGVLELFWDGGTKHKVLFVTSPTPIPFTAEIVDEERPSTVLGDAVETFDAAFKHWLPLIRQLGVVANSDPESKALTNALFLSGAARFPI